MEQMEQKQNNSSNIKKVKSKEDVHKQLEFNNPEFTGPLVVHRGPLNSDIPAAENNPIPIEPMFGPPESQREDQSMSQTPQLLNENESNMTIGNRDLATLDDQGQNSYLMAFQDKVDKESISSQRTLRYNDFELIAKQAENDPSYELPLDDGQSQEERDQKDTERAATDFRKST